MTEAEWLVSVSPHEMLTAIGSTLSSRKLRLLSGRIAHLALKRPTSTKLQLLAADPETRPAWEALALAQELIEDLDRFADREVSAKRLRRSLQRLTSLYRHWSEGAYVARNVIGAAIESPPRLATLLWPLREDINLANPNRSVELIRDLVGNPFRPVALDVRWRTEDVVGLARGLYEDRAFDRMAILADALMDACCDDEDILSHCRSDGPHVRGCWVVDLILGKQ
jgi:hypothetical protein